MKTREEIVSALQIFIEAKGSQNNAARVMKGVSAATLSQMMNHNWGLIKEDMWRRVESYVCNGVLADWREAETKTYKQLTTLFETAQREKLVLCVTGEPGTGKTFTSKMYEMQNKNVYRIQCSEFWTKSDFIEELLRISGLNSKAMGMKKAEKLAYALEGLKVKKDAILIFDEFDKLCDQCWYLFITLYNEVEDGCGIVTLSTDYITKRLTQGVRKNKKGYKEIWSRLGNKCVELAGVSEADVKKVCEANGVVDEQVQEDIAYESNGDLRRAKRRIFVNKR